MTEKPSHEALERKVRELEHARDVLRAVRDLNQLILLEKDPVRLLDQACRLLVQNRGYFNAWMTRMVDGRPVEPFHHAGFDRDFAPIADRIRNGKIPECVRGALEPKHKPLNIWNNMKYERFAASGLVSPSL